MTPQGAKRRERPSEPGKEEKPDSGRLTGLTAAAHQRSAPPGLLLRNVSKTSEPSSRDRAAPTAHLPSAPGHRRARAGSAQTRPRPAHGTHGTHGDRHARQLRTALDARAGARSSGFLCAASQRPRVRGQRAAVPWRVEGTAKRAVEPCREPFAPSLRSASALRRRTLCAGPVSFWRRSFVLQSSV